MTKRFTPPSAHSVSAMAIAAALAAFAGVAAAQSTRAAPAHPGFVVDSGGSVVHSAFGECVRPGQSPAAPSAACPPATATRTAAAGSATGAQAAPAAGAAPAAAAGSTAGAPARLPGYAVSSDGRVVQNGFGQCVRAGHWVPANAAEPCDLVARASVPPPAPVAAAPEPKLEPAPAPLAQAAPAPTPAPLAAPEPPRPVIQKLTLSADVLFDFGKAELRDAGKARLDELADQVKDADVDEIVAVGYADRIASEGYNQKLSEERAQAVKRYLEERGAKGNRVIAEGKGESAPVTGDDCKKMGPERASNRKLVACLQPDRRVEIEVLGTRQVAGGEAPAAGATSAPASSGAPTAPGSSGASSTTR